jgi:hypothetical protein
MLWNDGPGAVATIQDRWTFNVPANTLQISAPSERLKPIVLKCADTVWKRPTNVRMCWIVMERPKKSQHVFIKNY